MLLKFSSFLAIILFLPGCSVFGIMTVDEPKYEVISKEDEFELRKYPELVVAETKHEANFNDASSKAFRRLFDYISGDNLKAEKITMTAPVLMSNESETIKEDLPFFIEEQSAKWSMSFVLPDKYNYENAPKPTNELVMLNKIPTKKSAVLKFSGSWSLETFNKKSVELKNWLEKKNLKAVSQFRFAGYNPPWTIPFLKRNEVHVDVE